jgi:exosortase A-associated hydrolase 2
MTLPVNPNPFFLDGTAGKLFSIYYPASSETSHVIVHAPAFAEEMNKARRMVSLQAADLARRGTGVLILDLFGTGDSEGDFGEARWDQWLDDLEVACAWVKTQGIVCISLWGLRLGGLLAMDFAARTENKFEQLVLWQPALNGKNLILQFLRLRVAAGLFSSDGVRGPESTASLRDRLIAGQSVEVAGYELGPDLVNPIMKLQYSAFEKYPFKKIHLFEIASTVGKAGSAAYREWLSALQEKGLPAAHETVLGPAFWSTQDIAVAPALLEKTTHCLTDQGS